VDFDTSTSCKNSGDNLVYSSGKVVKDTDIQPPGNAIFTVNDSIQIISQEFPSFAIKKTKDIKKTNKPIKSPIWASVQYI
jgi:hypothetical protein